MELPAFSRAQNVVQILAYATSFFLLALSMYYVPDYSFLEAMTAEHSAGILNAVGMTAKSTVVGTNAYVNEVQIVRECTGIQVVAVFTGLLLPLPKVRFSVKLRALVLLGFSVYLANVVRIVVELWLMYAGILPWEMSHGPVGDVLAVITVFIFVLIADKFIPQIGVYLDKFTDKAMTALRWTRRT